MSNQFNLPVEIVQMFQDHDQFMADVNGINVNFDLYPDVYRLIDMYSGPAVSNVGPISRFQQMNNPTPFINTSIDV